MVPAKAETHIRDPRAWGKQEPGGEAQALGSKLPLEQQDGSPAIGAGFWLRHGCPEAAFPSASVLIWGLYPQTKNLSVPV